MTDKEKKKSDDQHDKFVGVQQVTQTVDLIYYDGPLVQATVVKDKNAGGPFRLQLDYYADEDLKDNSGYVGVRWTKADLQRMINMLEITEGIFNEQREQQQDANQRENSGSQEPNDGS